MPTEVRLTGWLGPTLFSSVVRDAQLETLASFRSELREHLQAQWLVIGAQCETQTAQPTAYAAFCADSETGRVVLIDLTPPFHARFVNSGLNEFMASVAAFVSRWPQYAASDTTVAASILAEIRAELAAIDAVAMSDDDGFWPTSLETYR